MCERSRWCVHAQSTEHKFLPAPAPPKLTFPCALPPADPFAACTSCIRCSARDNFFGFTMPVPANICMCVWRARDRTQKEREKERGWKRKGERRREKVSANTHPSTHAHHTQHVRTLAHTLATAVATASRNLQHSLFSCGHLACRAYRARLFVVRLCGEQRPRSGGGGGRRGASACASGIAACAARDRHRGVREELARAQIARDLAALDVTVPIVSQAVRERGLRLCCCCACCELSCARYLSVSVRGRARTGPEHSHPLPALKATLHVRAARGRRAHLCIHGNRARAARTL